MNEEMKTNEIKRAQEAWNFIKIYPKNDKCTLCTLLSRNSSDEFKKEIARLCVENG